MPLPRTKLEFSRLKQQIFELSALSEEELSNSSGKLRKAKATLASLLQDCFLILPMFEGEEFDLITLEFFKEKMGIRGEVEASNEDFVGKIFQLFLVAKRIKYRLDNISLNDSEINKQIEPKFCKVVSPYGEGTGYIFDTNEGIILSSFHLVSAIKPLPIENVTSDFRIVSVLYAAKLVNMELRVADAGRLLVTKEELAEKIRRTQLTQSVHQKIDISPEDIPAILNDGGFRVWMVNALQNAIKSSSGRISFSNNKQQLKLIVALIYAGYLDFKFCVTEKTRNQNLDTLEIIPTSKEYLLFLKEMPKADAEAAKDLFFLDDGRVLNDVWAFFARAKHEKEVELLCNTVEIHCGGEVLRGIVEFPTDIQENNKQTLLKSYAYFDTVPIRITHFKENVSFAARTKVIHTGRRILPIPEGEILQTGMRVYFGGYPLTQQEYTFSSGIVSAVTITGSRRAFVIEAPIAPGNSGSPVFVQKNGEVYWIGIVNSEVAHVTEQMMDIRDKLERMPEGMKLGEFGFVGAFKEITTTLLGNLMTGKGKAFEVRSLENLYHNIEVMRTPFMIDPFLDFLVPKNAAKAKGRNDIRERIKLEQEESKNLVIFDVFEHQDVTYHLLADNHNKHVRMSKVVTDEVGRDKRYLKERWGNKDATFNASFAARYREVIREVIVAIAISESSARYVRFESVVGWDKGASKTGEETDIVELYYEDSGIGSHIRPKAESALKRGEEIIDFRNLRQRVENELASGSTLMRNKRETPFVDTGFGGRVREGSSTEFSNAPSSSSSSGESSSLTSLEPVTKQAGILTTSTISNI